MERYVDALIKGLISAGRVFALQLQAVPNPDHQKGAAVLTAFLDPLEKHLTDTAPRQWKPAPPPG